MHKHAKVTEMPGANNQVLRTTSACRIENTLPHEVSKFARILDTITKQFLFFIHTKLSLSLILSVKRSKWIKNRQIKIGSDSHIKIYFLSNLNEFIGECKLTKFGRSVFFKAKIGLSDKSWFLKNCCRQCLKWNLFKDLFHSVLVLLKSIKNLTRHQHL